MGGRQIYVSFEVQQNILHATYIPVHKARVSKVAEADRPPREGLRLGVAPVEPVRATAAGAAARPRPATHHHVSTHRKHPSENTNI